MEELNEILDLYGKNGLSGPKVYDYYQPCYVNFFRCADGSISATIVEDAPRDNPLSELLNNGRIRELRNDNRNIIVLPMNRKNPKFQEQLTFLLRFFNTNFKYKY